MTELPPFLAADAIRAGDLVELLPQCPLPLQKIHLLYPSHRHPSSIIRTYLDFCQAEISLISKDWLQQGEVLA
ncbi:LysR substrate binding domain protein [compost metagenome]